MQTAVHRREDNGTCGAVYLESAALACTAIKLIEKLCLQRFLERLDRETGRLA